MTAPVFPTLPGLTYPLTRSPIWSTVKQDTVSGKRTRYPNRNLPVYQYELIFEFLREDAAYLEWQTLMGFFNSVFGATYVFQFNDPDDCTATVESFGEGDGAATEFQLTRAGDFGFAEPVFCPTGTPAIFVGGVQKATPADYSIDMTTGIVTFTIAPVNGAALTWTGAYNWYARFDDDAQQFSKFANNFWELKKITLTTELL